MSTVTIGSREVGTGQPVYVIAEIGINHNGSLETAKRLIDSAKFSGCDAVKFQKRTPEICTPRDQWDLQRDTPWGRMTYIDYRHRIEFDQDDYDEIDRYCREVGIDWFASCWDQPSVDFLVRYNPPAYKFASASLTDDDLLTHTAGLGPALIASSGMSTIEQIEHGISLLPADRTLLAHSTSTYPCPPEELNLLMILTLQDRFVLPIGYSGHEVGLQTTIAAVALGACFVERHITLDRTMWGSDQAASVEPMGLFRLVRDIRVVHTALGDGIKRVYDSEIGPMKKLRRVG